MERVMIFIDGSNLYHGLKNNSESTKVDYEKLALCLCGKRKLIRVYYYNAPIKQRDDENKYKNQQRFFNKLKSLQYFEVRLGRLEKRGNTYIEKGVDINIVVDMIRYAINDAYDTAILVSGDGDFESAVQMVKDRGKHVENAYFRKGFSHQLKTCCDKFIDIEQIINKCYL